MAYDNSTYRVWPYSRWKTMYTFVLLPILFLAMFFILHDSLYKMSPHLIVFVLGAIFFVLKYITGGEQLTLTPQSLTLGKKSIDPSNVSAIDINGRIVSICMRNGKKRSFRLFKGGEMQVQTLINDLQNYVWKYGIEVRVSE